MELTSNLCTFIVYLCLVNRASSLKYEFVDHCHFYNRGETLGIDNVTFICDDRDRENSVFKTSGFECSNYLTQINYKWPGTIDFQNCQFSTIKRNYFETFFNMHTFIISNVELKALQIDIFRDARNVTKLDVSQNQLVEIPELIFFNAEKLKYLSFFNNTIERVDFRAFEGATRLETLNLSYNRINEIDSRTFILSNLLVLDLSNNNLTKLVDHTFDKLVTLKQLNLSFNNIGNLVINTFIYLSKLEVLNLRRTNLSNIQLGTFSHQHKFVSLDLSENNLNKLDFKLFFPILKDLRSLRLAKNQLKDLDGFRNSLFPQLNSLHMQGNQFNCSYLVHFMESVSWEKIHFDLDVSSLDANKSNIRGISCDMTDAGENVDGATTQIAAKTTPNLSNPNTPTTFTNNVDLSAIEISLIFLCIATVIFIILYAVANLNKIRCQFAFYQRHRKSESKENVVEFSNDGTLST